MRKVELALLEWSQDGLGPRLLGRISDPVLVARAKTWLSDEHARTARHLAGSSGISAASNDVERGSEQ